MYEYCDQGRRTREETYREMCFDWSAYRNVRVPDYSVPHDSSEGEKDAVCGTLLYYATRKVPITARRVGTTPVLLTQGASSTRTPGLGVICCARDSQDLTQKHQATAVFLFVTYCKTK